MNYNLQIQQQCIEMLTKALQCSAVLLIQKREKSVKIITERFLLKEAITM